MKTEMVYPEWVQEHRTRGTTVKKVGGTYYLYKRTSKRVPGKKYPQSVDTYVGIITPDGVIESKKKKLATTSVGDDWEELHFSLSSQAGMLSRRFYKAYGIEFETLKSLMNIYLVYIEKEAIVSKISEEQPRLAS